MVVFGSGQRNVLAYDDRLESVMLKDSIFIHQIQRPRIYLS